MRIKSANIYVGCSKSKKVRRILPRVIRSWAYVSPPCNNWVAVYDEGVELNGLEEMKKIAQYISASLCTYVLGSVINDDSELIFVLYKRGKLSGQYCRNYAAESGSRFSAETLSAEDFSGLLSQPKSDFKAEEICRLLEAKTGTAEEICNNLTMRLGIDNKLSSLGFGIIDKDRPLRLKLIQLESFQFAQSREYSRNANQFLAAIKNNDRKAIKHYLNQGFSPNLYCAGQHYFPWDTVFLHSLCEQSSITTIKMLVKAGADINAYGTMAIVRAIIKKSPGLVRYLIEQGAQVNPLVNSEYAPLMIAASNSLKRIVKLLIEAGADVNRQESSEYTALIETILGDYSSFGYFISTEEMLPYQINDIKADRNNIVAMLLEAGADTELKSRTGETALCYAAARGAERIVRLLIDKGAGVNVKTNYGLTPIAIAALHEHQSVVKILEKAGADTSILKNVALLKEVSRNGMLETIVSLLRQGADINCRDESGKTPLICACKAGNPAIVDVLIEKGAKVHMRDRQGNAALIWAASKGLLKYGIPTQYPGYIPQEKMEAVQYIGIVKILIEAGAIVDARNRAGETALMQAIRVADPEIASILIQVGADVNVHDKGNFTTPLQDALFIPVNRKINMMLIALLADSGADIHYKTRSGLSAVRIAEFFRDEEMLELLRGAEKK